ncbi:MarR family winged helix-turn-helix transcriptional regulator [Amnibacterium sp.]|uniref:MarR family winged helix-turn-helix transcriptional regulator n=1 Tax=Amnibacterium sp. TaxID=1872496 RepID=UPI003F7BEE81
MTDEPAADLAALGRAFEEIVTWLRRTRTATDISVTALSLLDRLDVGGDHRVTDLAALEGITQPATTGLVNRLEARGWAARSADPSDGRASLVTITDAGRARLREHREDRSRRIAERLASLDAADQAALLAALPALRHLTTAPAARPTT